MSDSGCTDYLTGLLNRKGLNDSFHEIDPERKVQLLFLDLDNFKIVNDMYGHGVGDETLITFARILEAETPEGALITRLGGDEFAVLIPGFYTRDKVAEIADAILNSTRAKRDVSDAFRIVTASVGIVWDIPAGEGLDNILSNSDSAMYLAKEFGKDGFVFFDDFEDQIFQEKDMELKVADALKSGDFEMRYSPVVNLQSSKLIRTKAICRWNYSKSRILTRSDYCEVMEKSGFIKNIDLFAFEQICRDFADMKKQGKYFCIDVDFSYLLLMQEDFVETLKEIMNQYSFVPSDFEIAVDEKSFGIRGAGKIIECLDAIVEAGFSVSVTNFGSDFASIGHLRDISASAIEFNMDFIRNNINTRQGRRILGTFFSLGRDLSFLVIGSGVNDANDVVYLATNGCDAASGQYYGELYSAAEYFEFVRKNSEVADLSFSYEFKNNLKPVMSNEVGSFIGNGVEFAEGISDNYGALKFPGGQSEDNLVSFPVKLIPVGSHTVSMWIKPMEVQNWISVFFVRYTRGFESFMPTVSGGVSIYRRHADVVNDVDKWSDILTAVVPLRKWTYVTMVYDNFNDMMRLYLNGELVGHIRDVEPLGEVSMVYLGGDVYQESFRGFVSAFQVHSGVRTGEEIAEIYESFKSEPGYRGDEAAEEAVEYIVHDPAVYEDPISKKFYLYTTDAVGWTSNDMVHFKSLGRVVEGVGEEALSWTGSEAVWAPDIVKVGDEYRLYCSNSSWGVQRSCIFMAVSKKASGPFVPKAVVLKTDETLDVNGIDANIIADHETGEQYLLYGSFWGGVHIMPLDKETGLARNAGEDNTGVGSLKLMKDYREGMTILDLPDEERIKRRGKCIARRPLWNDGAIEGPYMVYDNDSGYYFLFVSYGSLRNDYNIRVGRSKNITGPFLDFNGRDMTDVDDKDCSVGLLIACGYKWLGGTGNMGPGHNSVIFRENGEKYLVCHIRKQRFCEQDPGPGFLQIRKLFISPDGWPFVCAEPYKYEVMNCVRDEIISGVYERIELRPSVPQGVMHAHPMELLENGDLLICSVRGRWERTGDYTLRLSYGDTTEYIRLEKGVDAESEKTTIILSGISSRGICTWAKKKNYM